MSTCARCKKEADIRPHNSSGICFECATKVELMRSEATMSIFTDDDLKRLKEDMSCICTSNKGCMHKVWGPPDLLALLARLEAAELILDNGLALTHDEDCIKTEWIDLECDCGANKRWKAWRKVAGKDIQ